MRAPSKALLPSTSMQLPPTPTIWPFLTFHCSPGRPTQGMMRTGVPSIGYPCHGRLAHWLLELLTIWLAHEATDTARAAAGHRCAFMRGSLKLAPTSVPHGSRDLPVLI